MSRSIFSISRSSISRSLIVVAASLATIFVSNASLNAATKSHAQRDQGREQANLAKEVRHQLVMLPYLTVFDNLEYKVDGTKVTLMGQVTQPVLKEDAGRAVKGVEGVAQVDNQIQALPPSPMDDQIRHAEFRSIYGFPSLSRYSWGAIPQIHIVVDSGHVTLYGIVDNQGDKDTAGLRANTVPNVFSVTNNLQVAGPGK